MPGTDALHSALTGTNIHVPYRFTYADAAARAAEAGAVAGDVGCLALQQDNNSLWMLTDNDPLTWVSVADAGATAVDSDDVTYTPTVLTDWDSDADPGDVEQALDQLAERIDDVEPLAIAQRATINFIFGKVGGDPVAANEELWAEIPWAASVAAVRMLSNESTTTVIDLWAEGYADYPPTDADTITSVTPPTITAGVKSEDTTLTNWLGLAAGDILLAHVDSNDNAEQVTLAVTIVRTA